MGLTQDTLHINATQTLPPLCTVAHEAVPHGIRKTEASLVVEGSVKPEEMAPGRTLRKHKLWSVISPYN